MHLRLVSAPRTFPTPSSWWNRLVVKTAVWQDCAGIPVTFTGWREPAPAARAKLAAGLSLLAQAAPAQAARFVHLSRGIVVARLHTAAAAWRPDLHACLLDIAFLSDEDTSPATIAAAVIHELTHARLLALGFAHTSERRARIEQICHRAERNFLASLPESADRRAALMAIAESLALDPSVWSDDAVRQRERHYPWYIRAPRSVFRRLRNLDH